MAESADPIVREEGVAVPPGLEETRAGVSVGGSVEGGVRPCLREERLIGGVRRGRSRPLLPQRRRQTVRGRERETDGGRSTREAAMPLF